jgi:tetratricopeptide (TPR) repeat protein
VATIDSERLQDLARDALAKGTEEAALLELAPAAEAARSARLWQFTGLLQRSLDRHADALRSFSAAARLAPDDVSIAQGLARVGLEAGVDAVPLFERALQLDPSSGSSLLGLVASKFSTGRGAEAEAQLDLVVGRSPTWIDGHVQLGQLRSMLGRPEQATLSIERALFDRPGDEALWTALLNLTLAGGDFASLDEKVARARSARLPEATIMPFEAVAATELGEMDRADRLFEGLDQNARGAMAVWHVRHLLRAERIEQALALIDRKLEGERSADLWPYASIAWRLAGDPRSNWLEAGGKLVSTFDLTAQLPPLDRLSDVLRSLHVASGQYLDQSVRGGTQTDGPLLSRIEPEIQRLRAAIVGAVEDYRANLPAIDPKHPTLSRRRDARIRFSGSWSVRLRTEGHHVAHVHPQGWISSAFYAALPEGTKGDLPNPGWLKLGEPPTALGLRLGETQLVEPEVGRLVLFPSWMWHGTVPFAAGERLTAAFDVRQPS